MQCKQAHDYAQIKCKQTSSWASPLLVCFSCPRILILLNSSMLFPLCPLSMSNFYFSPWCISYLCSNFSPFVINFHKRFASFDTKDCIGVDDSHLNLAFFYGQHHKCWNDNTCSPWDTSCRIFWPWYQLVGHLPLYHSMGHPIDKLELLYVRELASLDDHLKLRITCGTAILYEWYHV